MLSNVYIWYVTTEFLFSVCAEQWLDFSFSLFRSLFQCLLCVRVLYIKSLWENFIYIFAITKLILSQYFANIFFTFFWKYYQCNIRIAETLTFIWKFSQFTVNISPILVLHWEYFQHYVSISPILEIYW